jgi:hypothetical protein
MFVFDVVAKGNRFSSDYFAGSGCVTLCLPSHKSYRDRYSKLVRVSGVQSAGRALKKSVPSEQNPATVRPFLLRIYTLREQQADAMSLLVSPCSAIKSTAFRH